MKIIGDTAASPGAASEHELYRQLGRKVEQQAVVAELGRRALTGATLDELRREAVELTSAALGTEKVAILVPEPDGHLHCRANVGWPPEQIRPVPLAGESMLAHTFSSLEPVVVSDLEQEERFAGSRHLLDYGLVSAISVVIRGPEQPHGVLAAHSRTRLSFSEDDVLFLRGVANVISAAAAHELADRARGASEERLAFLAEASHLLARSLDVDETLDQVASLVVPRLADWCIVHLADGDNLVATVFRHQDPAAEEWARRAALDRSTDMSMRSGPPEVFRTGRSELATAVDDAMIDDAIVDPERRARVRSMQIRSAMIVPLVARGSVIGVVTLVSSTEGRNYGPDDLALAEEIARRAGLAVDNARLHDAAGAARERAERLQRVTARLSAALTPEQVTEVVLSEGIEATGALAGLVALVEPDGETVRVAAHVGYPEGRLDGWATFPVDAEVPVSAVVRSGESVFCRTAEERNTRFPSMQVVEPGHALATLPLVAGGRALGGFVLSFGADRDFGPEERGLLQALAAQCAQALERGGLYAENARQRAQFESVLRQMPSGVVIAEAATRRILLANDQVETVWGARLAAGDSVDEVNDAVGGHAADGREYALEEWPLRRALDRGEVVQNEDLLVRRPDGWRAVLRISAAPVRAPGGEVVAGVAVFHDVTAEVESRRETERRADAARALAFVADGVLLVDTSGVVRLWNDAAARITGLPAEAVVGKPLEEAVEGWRSLAGRVPVTAAGGGPVRPPTLPLDVGGRELWLSISAVAFADGTVYAFRDATEEHALEQMKSDFIATVSHELRTPLAAVYGAAATLRHRASLDPDERERFLEMISDQAERLSAIVNDILIASRIDAGGLPVSVQPLDAAAIARQVLDVAERGAPPGFELRLQAADDLPRVLADPDRLKQALGNLVENAVKYSSVGGSAEVLVEAGDRRVRFRVRDRGIGIPDRDRERIFEKFFRVDAAMTGGVSGTGLGLYIVRELVERMGGRVRVESTLGAGSEFTIELPAA